MLFRSIRVTHTPGVLTEATADLTLALLLAVARRVVEGAAYARDGLWKAWHPELLLGLDLQGGISVVLEPIGNPKPGSVDVAVDIIRSRVDSLGVAEPEISRQGGNIVAFDQYSDDPRGGAYFQRVVFHRPDLSAALPEIRADIA